MKKSGYEEDTLKVDAEVAFEWEAAEPATYDNPGSPAYFGLTSLKLWGIELYLEHLKPETRRALSAAVQKALRTARKRD